MTRPFLAFVTLLAVSSGCVGGPRSRTAGYVAGAAVAVAGGALVYRGETRQCSADPFPIGDIGCGVGASLESALGVTLAVVGLAAIGVTALAPRPAEHRPVARR